MVKTGGEVCGVIHTTCHYFTINIIIITTFITIFYNMSYFTEIITLQQITIIQQLVYLRIATILGYILIEIQA